MTDEHLENTINMLKRHAAINRENEINKFFSYPEPTAEGASISYEQECHDLTMSTPEDFAHSILMNLELEAERRACESQISL